MAKNTITKVIKRNGMTVAFDQERITNAIFKSALSIGEEDRSLAQKVSDAVVASLNENFSDEDPPTVEDIQDTVVGTLQKLGHHKNARAYREYRDEHARTREEKESQIIVNDTIPYKILWQVFTWNVDNYCDSIEKINQQIRDGSISKLIQAAEVKYHDDVARLAEKIIKRKKDLRIIIIAGPSSSGKTTTTIKLTEHLKHQNIDVVPLNLDNYFLDLESHPKDQFGDYDFEVPEALEISLINQHLSDLLNGKTIEVPRYNFKIGQREEIKTSLSLKSNQILLIDCLHGLYKPLTASIPDDFKFKFYIETLCQTRDKKGEFVRWTDIRLMRRMVRDSWQRRYTPVQTVGHWHYVRRSEMKFIVPYIGNVDFIINGSLPYELAVHKKYLFKYKDEIISDFEKEPKRFDAYIRASRIYELLDSVEELKDDSIIPANSLIREFIGGSIYSY